MLNKKVPKIIVAISLPWNFFFKGTVTRKTTIFLQNQNTNIIFKKKTIDEKTGRHGSTIKEKRPKHFGKQNLSVTLKIEDLSILTWIDG